MPFLVQRRKSRKHLAGASAILAICSATPNANALEPSDFLVFSKGPFSLRPQLYATTEYNDNVLYRKTNVVGDLINTISPGLRMLLGEDLPEANHVLFEYFLDQSWYLDQDELNATQHRIRLTGQYSTGRTTISGTDRIDFLSTTLGGGFSAAGRKVDRTVFSDLYRLEYRVGQRTEVYGEIEHGAVDYENGITLFDSRTLQGTLGFGWRYSEDSRIFGEIYYGQTELQSNFSPTDPPGKTFVGGFIGARGKFTEKLSGLVKAGYEVNEFDRTATFAATEAGSSPVVEASLVFQATERTSLELDYSRRQRISVEFATSAYTSDEVTLSGRVILGQTGRLRLNAGASYGNYAYEPSVFYATRTDTILSGRVGASWFFETWLFARLQYEYSNYSSDLPRLIDYTQNRVTLGVGIGF